MEEDDDSNGGIYYYNPTNIGTSTVHPQIKVYRYSCFKNL